MTPEISVRLYSTDDVCKPIFRGRELSDDELERIRAELESFDTIKQFVITDPHQQRRLAAQPIE